MSITTPEWCYRVQKIDIVEIQYCTETENYIKFRPQRCQKYASQPKKLQIKVFWNWILPEKVRDRIPSITPQSGAIGLERLILSKYNIVTKLKITLNLGLNAAKNTHSSKKASNKSFSELNFAQKSARAHTSMTPHSGARWLERLILSKYNIVLKLKITLNLDLIAAKNAHSCKSNFK